MKQTVSESYVRLFAQFANIYSVSSAERAIATISTNLNVCLPKAQAQMFFSYTPPYLVPSKKMFGLTKLGSYHHKQYNQTILYERIKLQFSLTDTREVTHLLAAYFRALEVVVGKTQFTRIARCLPREMFYS